MGGGGTATTVCFFLRKMKRGDHSLLITRHNIHLNMHLIKIYIYIFKYAYVLTLPYYFGWMNACM